MHSKIHPNKKSAIEFINKTYQNQDYQNLTLTRIINKFINLSVNCSHFLNFHYFFGKIDEKNSKTHSNANDVILGISLEGISVFTGRPAKVDYRKLKYEFSWEMIKRLVVSGNGKRLDIYREVAENDDQNTRIMNHFWGEIQRR